MLLILWLPMIINVVSVGGHLEDDDYDDYEDEFNDGHSDSIMRFSYSDDDPKGPHSWNNEEVVLSADPQKYGKNLCALDKGAGWKTPLNIDTKKVVAPEDGSAFDTVEDNLDHPSLVFHMSDPALDQLEWVFGHPADSYHGIEVRAPFLGTFQINDRYDHIGNLRELQENRELDNLKYNNYDFSFMSIYYCDPQKASPQRSMHQIDGEKFPLELQFMFYSEPPRIGIGKYVCDLRNPENPDALAEACIIPTMVVVMGEFGDTDNPRLQPLINAAMDYEGPSFNANDMHEDYGIRVKGPWSPTWLIPYSSTYYYYDVGNLPVPPCFWVARIYVIKERIKISKRQLNVLTNIKTKREPTTGGKMPCTYSVLRQNRDEDRYVKYYQWPYTIIGNDHRKMTEEENKKLEERRKAVHSRGRGGYDENENSGCKLDLKEKIPIWIVSLVVYYFL